MPIPWGYRWRAWVWGEAWTYKKLLRDHWAVVCLAVLGLLFILHLGIAHCAEHGNFLVMDQGNLTFAEFYLKNHGHQVKAHEGVVLGELVAREAGTGTAAVRGRDKNGCWQWWVWQTEKGIMVKLQVYPAKAPAGFKGD